MGFRLSLLVSVSAVLSCRRALDQHREPLERIHQHVSADIGHFLYIFLEEAFDVY